MSCLILAGCHLKRWLMPLGETLVTVFDTTELLTWCVAAQARQRGWCVGMLGLFEPLEGGSELPSLVQDDPVIGGRVAVDLGQLSALSRLLVLPRD